MTNPDPLLRLLRYVLPVAAILVALWTGYATATHKRYAAINGVPGELLAGGSLGQTFVAHYDGLSGVELQIGTYEHMTDTTRSTLVMHLRPAPDSPQDIATATLPPDRTIERNPWYAFTFAPIPDSQGKTYYAIIEAPDGLPGQSMTVFWFQPQPRGDPYAGGVAYRDGTPTPGDLAFGLQYSAPPWQVWVDMIDKAGENTSGWLLWSLLTVGAGGIILFVVHPPRLADEKSWRSLLLALAVGLVYGLLFMLITPPWQGPDEYAHYAYAALLDKHDLDNSKVQGLDLYDRDRDVALIKAVNSSADRNDFTRRLSGNNGPGVPTRADAFLFQQVRQPPTYYWLCALALRAARTVGIPADPYAQPEVSLYTMRAVSLLLSLLVVALAWFAFGLRIAVAVTLLPMHTFMATVINNDILAEVAVSTLVVTAVALLKTTFASETEWSNKRGVALVGICVLLAVAGLATKATAFAAALPLLVTIIAIWLAVGLFRKRPLRFAATRLLMAILTVGVLGIGAFFAIFEPRVNESAGWFTSYTPLTSAQRVAVTSAHNGSHAIQLDATAGASAVQRVVPPLILHPALRVTLAGWLRLEPGQGQPGANQVTGELAIMDGRRQAGTAVATLTPGDEWSRLEVAGDIEANAEVILLQLGVRNGTAPGSHVQFDDLSLRVEPVGGTWNDPVFKAALVDPSGEQARWAFRSIFESILPGEVENMASAILNPQPFSKAALWSDYATAQYTSFWGSFGWLSINLPTAVYLLIGVLLLLALVGLFIQALRNRKTAWGWQSWLAVVTLISLGLAIIISFTKQMALTAYGGLPSAPQGRYLFVLFIPVVWLLSEGLRLLVKTLGPRSTSLWGLTLATLLLLFAMYTLLALVMPYYYG